MAAQLAGAPESLPRPSRVLSKVNAARAILRVIVLWPLRAQSDSDTATPIGGWAGGGGGEIDNGSGRGNSVVGAWSGVVQCLSTGVSPTESEG